MTVQAIKSLLCKDEGGSHGIGIQVQVPNRLQVLPTKAVVLSVIGMLAAIDSWLRTRDIVISIF
jgi:hypothetical protein